MLFAKIKNNSIVQFPYGWDTLFTENPNSTYDNRFSLAEWYAQTELAITEEDSVVEVTEEPAPEFDAATHNLSKQANPTLVDDVWVLGWNVTAKTPEEIALYQARLTQADHT